MSAFPVVAALLLASQFTEMREYGEIRYVNVSGDVEKRYILGSLGGGVGLIDYDGPTATSTCTS